MDWIKCEERLPLEMPLKDDAVFRSVECIVTDEMNVGTCDFQSGRVNNPWREWSNYGDIAPEKITRWMPMPDPPRK